MSTRLREGKRSRAKLRPYLLALPALVVTIGILYPFALGVYYTFFDYAANNRDPGFAGGDNYGVLVGQGSFWRSVSVTVEYAVLATAIETVLGIAVALLLYRASFVAKVLEKVLILPLMIAPVIAAIVWSLMFNNSIGILNHVLSPFGLGGLRWTGTPTSAFLSSVLVDVWVFTPFVALLVLAGLRSLPRDPFEAALVEGASAWYTFRKLTLRMVWPYILVAVIFRFMDSIKIFDIVFALTKGGPGDATAVLQVRAYEKAITFTDFSAGLTYMVLLWIVVFIVSRVLVSVLGKAQRSAAGA